MKGSGTAADNHETAKWDPAFTKQIANAIGPWIKRWYRAEVRNVDNVPAAGGALVVSNHSGGMLTPDVLIFSPAFYHTFGYDRPIYTLGHYGLFMGPLDGWLRRLGVIEASRENAAAALHSGAVVLVFPGGDYDSYRPTFSANTIDFNGRTGYVRTAIEAGVPIVPDRVDRRPGDPAVPDPWQLAGTQAGAHQSSDGHPAAELRVPVRPERDLPAERAAAGQDRHRGARADRRHRPIRQRTPTSRRSTPTCAR